jgi:rare lipoprotein A
MFRSNWTAVGMAAACLLVCAPVEAHSVKKISGVAAYYSKDYSGLTASGERYDPKTFTCAHRTLPFGTRVLVTDPRTHRSVVVTVNDRGPFSKGRVIDLSMAAAKELHMLGRGLIRVTAAVQ